MTERAYFKWHAQEDFTGRGAIVDLGCWLGSTTATLAMGLEANRHPMAQRAVIHSYDQFVWDWPMDLHSPPTRLGPYRPGDSFRAEFELVISRWRERVVVHEGDLLLESWTLGPVELLLVDAMKSWALASHIVRQFYPELTSAQGYLIHQDFSHCFTPWIPLISFRMLDYLEPVRDIPKSETLVFRLKRPVPRIDLDRASFDEAEIEQAFRHWLRITRPEKHSGLRAARILLAQFDGDTERAQSLRRSEGALLGDFHRRTLTAVMDGSE